MCRRRIRFCICPLTLSISLSVNVRTRVLYHLHVPAIQDTLGLWPRLHLQPSTFNNGIRHLIISQLFIKKDSSTDFEWVKFDLIEDSPIFLVQSILKFPLGKILSEKAIFFKCKIRYLPLGGNFVLGRFLWVSRYKCLGIIMWREVERTMPHRLDSKAFLEFENLGLAI